MTKVQLTFVSRRGKEFSEDQKEYFTKLTTMLEQIINTDRFKNDIRYFKHKIGRRWHDGFKLNKGFSPSEILNILLSGKDLYSDKDQIIDIHLNPYRKRKLKYHARTFKGRRSIGVNTTYLAYCMRKEKKGEALMAGTMIHEYMHIAGFVHYTNSGTEEDKGTVPWGIGDTVKKILKE